MSTAVFSYGIIVFAVNFIKQLTFVIVEDLNCNSDTQATRILLLPFFQTFSFWENRSFLTLDRTYTSTTKSKSKLTIKYNA